MPRRVRHMMAGLLLVAAGTCAADDTATLRVNPFLRPDAGNGAAAAAAATDTGAMELRGIMMAGALSLANIGGRIIGVGEQINGYRLVAVNTDGVVLEREGVREVLEVRNEDGAGHDTRVNASW